MAEIHPTAIVYPGAEIGEGTVVGPYSVIGPNVKTGPNNQIGPHVVIEGWTTIGEGNLVSQFASIGSRPQDLKYKGEKTFLEVGNRNMIREYVTLHPGTVTGNLKTVIGDENLFMACSHVGHDGIIGNKNVFANSCALAGHVTVGSRVIVGGMCGLHQFTRVGDLSILGANTMVSKDIPPYCMAHGDHARIIGLNMVGLKRAGFSSQDVARFKELFAEVLKAPGRLAIKLEAARGKYADFEPARIFLEFLGSGERGVAPVKSHGNDTESTDE